MESPGPAGASPAPRPGDRSRARRAATLVALSTLLPGSAHLVLGRRGGRAVVGLWLAGVLGAVGVVVAILVARDAVLGWLAQPWVLRGGLVLLLVVAIAWVVAILDALRLGRVGTLRPAPRAGVSLLALTCAAAVAFGATGVTRTVLSVAGVSELVFTGGGRTAEMAGRYNILLLGADDGADREGARFDSINVVSVDAATGKSVMIGIPRNLEWVPFPPSSPMRAKFPEGFYCPDHSCLINAINNTVESQYADLYPGVRHPGLEATKEAVEELTGLSINYWVVIDLAGFQQLIDAVGGVRIALDRAVPIWWDATETKVTYAIGPGSNVLLKGQDALWFVRARNDSNDYVRMSRQRCVMSAMLRQLDPATVLTKFSDIAAAGGGMVATDAPATEAGRLATLALKVRNVPYDVVALVPPAVYPGNPDLALVRRMVAEGIARSQPSPTASPTTTPSPSTPTATPSGALSGTPTPGRGGSTARTATTARPTVTRTTPRATPTPDPTPTLDPIQVQENCRPAA